MLQGLAAVLARLPSAGRSSPSSLPPLGALPLGSMRWFVERIDGPRPAPSVTLRRQARRHLVRLHSLNALLAPCRARSTAARAASWSLPLRVLIRACVITAVVFAQSRLGRAKATQLRFHRRATRPLVSAGSVLLTVVHPHHHRLGLGRHRLGALDVAGTSQGSVAAAGLSPPAAAGYLWRVLVLAVTADLPGIPIPWTDALVHPLAGLAIRAGGANAGQSKTCRLVSAFHLALPLGQIVSVRNSATARLPARPRVASAARRPPLCAGTVTLREAIASQ